MRAHLHTRAIAISVILFAASSTSDIVTWRLPSGVPHIGIVSTRTGPRGTPLIIHNIGRGTSKKTLFAFEVTGHYHYLRATNMTDCPR